MPPATIRQPFGLIEIGQFELLGLMISLEKLTVKKSTVVIAIAAILIIFAGVVGWPKFSLWFAKHQAWEKYSKMSSEDTAGLSTVLSPDVKKIHPLAADGERITYTVDGYLFSVPKKEYRRVKDRKERFENDKVILGCLGVLPLTASFPKIKEPKAETVEAYFSRTDPYQILVDAFNATPEGIHHQPTHDALQKHLLLLLLKTVLLPVGADKLFLQFETDRHKGILAGDTTMRGIFVNIYLPETKEFANLVILTKTGARMDDVYRCLAQLEIRKE